MRPGRATTRLGVLAVAALTAATLAPATAGQAAAADPRFRPIPVPAGMKHVPASMQDATPVKVVVQLEGRSVGDQTGDALDAGRSMSAAARSSARAALATRQQPVVDLVRARGGSVLARYQDAYNGVAVRVARKDLGALRALPGVRALHAVGTHTPDNVAGVQYIGGDTAWKDVGVTGKGVTVAIVDTGVDYTHADFGGPGTERAYRTNDRTVVEPGTFPTPKVVGGYDFVGDEYNANDEEHNTPQPDADPLDCDGHGTHVAGSAAGQGVTDRGATYRGPYDGTTYQRGFRVGPGVAPQASIYAYKVFGCEGSVDDTVIISALDRALQDGIDVVNMSLGSSFGTRGTAETDAVDAVSRAGVTVVASAGNAGSGAYISGAPASADRAISVAALDAVASLPGAHAEFSKTDQALDLQNSNEADFAEGLTVPVSVLRNPDGSVSLGCDPAEYQGHEGELVVTVRGTCARAARAVYGQKAGAAAVLMLNNTATYPPVEGKITSNPDTGEAYDVTIPFLGAPSTATSTLLAADGGTVTLTRTLLDNPGFRRSASFTSNGPRNGDSAVKPDVAAPGVSVISAGNGTGDQAATISGTSMAAPMTAGAAALVVQSRPFWGPERIKAALMGTASKDLLADYDVTIAGSGVVQAQKAVRTNSLVTAGRGQGTLSYGAEALGGAYRETLPMKVVNTGPAPMTYRISSEFVGDARGAVVQAPASITVPADSARTVEVTLSLSAAAVAALPGAEESLFGVLQTIRGAVLVRPASGSALRVPFLVAARGLSDVQAGTATPARPVQDSDRSRTTVPVTNEGVHTGAADVYSWGTSDARESDIAPASDIRALGVQSLPGAVLGGEDADRSLVFAVNRFGALSTASTQEIDIPVDADRDGTVDGYVIGIDNGAIFAGAFDGRYISVITDADFNVVNAFVADAPMNGATVLLPALASDLGLSRQTPRFSYAAGTFDLFGTDTDTTREARFNAYAPSVSTGAFEVLAPGASATLRLTFDRAAARADGTRGWMVVTMDDAAGAAQADLVRIPAAG